MSLLSTAQAANFLGVHTNTIYRYVQTGQLKAVRAGKLLRFREEDLTNMQPELAKANLTEPLWELVGDEVTVRGSALGMPRLYYAIILSELTADTRRWLQHLRKKTWWRPEMEEQLLNIISEAQAAHAQAQALAEAKKTFDEGGQ